MSRPSLIQRGPDGHDLSPHAARASAARDRGVEIRHGAKGGERNHAPQDRDCARERAARSGSAQRWEKQAQAVLNENGPAGAGPHRMKRAVTVTEPSARWPAAPG